MFVDFVQVCESDLPEIKAWIQAEETHRGVFTPEFFHRGGPAMLFSFKVVDAAGAVMYLRVNREIRNGELQEGVYRLLPQFAPESEVSKRRVARAILKGFPRFLQALQQTQNTKGLIFESTSSSAIHTMILHFGFQRETGSDNYILDCEQEQKPNEQVAISGVQQ